MLQLDNGCDQIEGGHRSVNNSRFCKNTGGIVQTLWAIAADICYA